MTTIALKDFCKACLCCNLVISTKFVSPVSIRSGSLAKLGFMLIRFTLPASTRNCLRVLQAILNSNLLDIVKGSRVRRNGMERGRSRSRRWRGEIQA